MPLVVLLHGIGGSGPAIARQYSIDEVSEGLNFAWIAPSARGRSWCAPGCRGRGRDGRNPDSVWLRSVVEAAMEIVNIDKQRIYFAGVSVRISITVDIYYNNGLSIVVIQFLFVCKCMYCIVIGNLYESSNRLTRVCGYVYVYSLLLLPRQYHRPPTSS